MGGSTDVQTATAPPEDEAANLSPRAQRRRVRLELTRTQVLDVAERAFAVTGFTATTIKSIAEQCEIAVGTVYTLFDDKDSIYEAVLRRRGAVLHELTRIRAAAPGPADAALVDLAELQVRFFREHADWAELASALGSGARAAADNTGTSRLYADGHQVVSDVHASVMARGQREGRIRDGDPRALALIFLGMLETFHRIDNVGHLDRPDYALTEFLDLVLSAFGSAIPAEGESS